jgi:methylenetetrahydrofolate reductase (NADPH)
MPDELLRRLERDSRAERLERAALLLAAVRELGFDGAHLGGFGLRYADFLAIIDRAAAIGSGWRGRMDELVFPLPGEFHLLPAAADGLSDGAGDYQLAAPRQPASFKLRVSRQAHRYVIAPESRIARWFAARLQPAAAAAAGGEWRRGALPALLQASTLYRHAVLGCVDCGDCIQDHLSYAACPMNRCYKELRNGPCGGSRPDGSCEAQPGRQCVWNLAYRNTLAAGEDPRRFATTLIPPRDWTLAGTNALLNRYAGLDNLSRRVPLAHPGTTRGKAKEVVHAADR